MKKFVLLFWAVVSGANSQTEIHGGIFPPSSVLVIPGGTSLPASCTVRQIAFKTDAQAGSNIYLCTATNTWTQITGSGSGGHVIQEEGIPLAQRTNLNFVGAGITAVDDPSNDRTNVLLSASLNTISNLVCSDDQILKWSGGTWICGVDTGGGGSGSPGNPVNSVQFNLAGGFGGDSNLCWDNTNKTFGIGTCTPDMQLTVEKSGSPANISARVYSDTNWHKPRVYQDKARGTKSAPSDVLSNEEFGAWIWNGYLGGNFRNVAEIAVLASGPPSGNNIPTRFRYRVNDGSTGLVERMDINANGGQLYGSWIGDSFSATSLMENGNQVPNSTDNLGFFASTTSSQFAGVISDETGSGLLTLNTNPLLVTPIFQSSSYNVTWAVSSTCSTFGNGGKLTVNANNQIVCDNDEGGAGGSGDITAVGDCSTGACFQSEAPNKVLASPVASTGQVTARALTDADIPDTITVSNYLPLSGGTLTGNLLLSNRGQLLLGELTSNGNEYLAIQGLSSMTSSSTLTWAATGPCTGTNGGALTIDSANNIICSDDDGGAGGGGGGYSTIQDEGVNLTQQTTVNFVGDGVVCSDAGSKTQCSINTGSFDESVSRNMSGLNQINVTDLSFERVNDSSSGTVLHRTVCITSTGTATQCTTATASRAVGICKSGCGTTGNSRIAVLGVLSCDFDGAVTAGHWVTVSTTADGRCTDAGTTKPSTPLGILIESGGGSGLYQFVQGVL